MSEKNDPETQPVRPTSAVETPASPPADAPPADAPPADAPPADAPPADAPSAAPAAAAPAKPTVGERLRTPRGLVAVALAALIVGGLGGAAVHAGLDGGPHDRGRFERGGPGPDGPGFGGPGPGRGDDRAGPRGLEQAPGDVPGETPGSSSDS